MKDKNWDFLESVFLNSLSVLCCFFFLGAYGLASGYAVAIDWRLIFIPIAGLILSVLGVGR